MDSPKIYSVGQMAELCNISAKQLRYLDDKKIIVPAVRDKNNNYRYYTEKQIEEILLVKEMKQLGVPLNRIAHLLNNRNVETLRRELNDWLVNAREEVGRALEKYDKTLEMVMRFITAKEFAEVAGRALSEAFYLAQLEPRPVVATRYPGIYSATQSFINRRAELYGIIEKYGLETTGPNMAIFHNGYINQFHAEPEKCQIDLEVCMVIKKMNVHCPNYRMLEGFSAITGVHVGHYRHMRATYAAMEAWAEERGLRLSGVSLEEYIIGETHTNNETTYITRIFLPLEGCALG